MGLKNRLSIIVFSFVLLFVSCSRDVNIISISCEDPKIEFYLNESFSPGKNFKLSILREDNSVQTLNAKKCDFFIDGNSAKNLKLKEVGQRIVTVKYRNFECEYNINVSEKISKKTNSFVKGITLIFIIALIIFVLKRKKKNSKQSKPRRSKEVHHNIIDISKNRDILSTCQKFLNDINGTNDSTGLGVKCRIVGHKIAKSVAENEGFLKKKYKVSPGKILNDVKFKKLMQDNVYKDFRYIIYEGNKAAHARDDVKEFTPQQIEYLKKDTKTVVSWYEKNYCN